VVEEITLCVPYYRQPRMLEQQLKNWLEYPDPVRFIVVDDGSPVDGALSIVLASAAKRVLDRLELYRVTEDIPWNRGGARNLASREAHTEWLVHCDLDHLLPAPCAHRLLECEPKPGHWYRFERYRVGAADETRSKDLIDPRAGFGLIRPHIDSYLIERTLYWKAGGYNESFSGCLGGGSPFLDELTRRVKPQLLPPDVHLHVYTRHVVPDASVTTLSRDRAAYARRKANMRLNGRLPGHAPVRFSWVKQL